MQAPRSGAITFLFSDIEGSTRAWEQQSDAMQLGLERHDAIMRDSIEAQGGYVFKTAGDAFFAAFASPSHAVMAALTAQLSLNSDASEHVREFRVRMALHAGEAQFRDGDYFGRPLNLAARLLAAGHGGQILLSGTLHDLVRDEAPPDARLRDLGEHRLRDIESPQRIFQVVHADLSADFPPLATVGGRPNNLKPLGASFVGREDDIDQIRDLLLTPEIRVLTLTGPGGIGKTTLAMNAALSLLNEFADGVFAVPLASVSQPANVLPTIASTLGLREVGVKPIAESLRDYLGDRRMLLVLDNFEHLLAAVPDVARLLDASDIKLLVTSREPLHLYGEQEMRVVPLPLPDGYAPSRDAALKSDAVRLFAERAAAAAQDFAVTDANAATITKICARLDGLPLAIELAAARIKLLPPEAILSRLDHSLRLLVSATSGVPERQRTVSGAIAWSYDLLAELEKGLFRALSVFSGGWTVPAAEQVLKATSDVDVLGHVSSLLDKSLIHRTATHGAEPRFAMLETVREFARERLDEADETADAEARHASFYCAMASAAGAELRTAEQVPWLQRLETEHDNLRLALTTLLDAGDALRLQKMAASLWPFWQLHSHVTDAQTWLDAALITSDQPSPDRAATLQARGELGWLQGKYVISRLQLVEAIEAWRALGDDANGANAMGSLVLTVWSEGDIARARELCEESIGVLRESVDTWGLAQSLHRLGHLMHDTGDYSGARETFAESLSLFRATGDAWAIAQPLKDLGLIAARYEDYATALPLYEESLTLLRSVGEKSHTADVLYRLAEMEVVRSNFDRAKEYLDEGLRLYREMSNSAGVVEALVRFADIAIQEDDLDHARGLYDESLQLAERGGHTRLVAGMLHNLAYMALRDGNVRTAGELFRRSMALHRELGRELNVVMCLAGFASIAAAMGDHAKAARLFGAAEAQRQRLGSFMDPFDRFEHTVEHERYVALARAGMSDGAFSAACADGRALSLADAILEAEEAASPGVSTPDEDPLLG